MNSHFTTFQPERECSAMQAPKRIASTRGLGICLVDLRVGRPTTLSSLLSRQRIPWAANALLARREASSLARARTPKHRDRLGREFRPEGDGFETHVEHDPSHEASAESLPESSETFEIICTRARGGLDLNPDNAPGGIFEDDVYLLTCRSAEVE